MGLPAGQQRVLDAIEGSLRAGEPELAAMYAVFTKLTRGESRPRREQLPDYQGLRSWPARIRHSMAQRRARAPRPLLRLLFIGQLMAILAVLGVLIGLGSSMAPAACTTRAGIHATATQSHVAPASCRGVAGK